MGNTTIRHEARTSQSLCGRGSKDLFIGFVSWLKTENQLRTG
jgi:hypothetical protein